MRVEMHHKRVILSLRLHLIKSLTACSEYLSCFTFSYPHNDSAPKKGDFGQGLCCLLQSYGDALSDSGGKRLFECSDVSQMNVSFAYDKNERVVSRFVHLKYTGEEDIFVSRTRVRHSFIPLDSYLY